MNHHLTPPVAGTGEDRLTAEIFMMLQRDDPGSELHRDVVNAVMQDRQAPPDFEERQQFQRMHQLQLLQQQQQYQLQHSQSSSSSNLWAQYQQNQQGPRRYQQDGDSDGYEDYAAAVAVQQPHQQTTSGTKKKPAAKKPAAKKPKKPSKKKASKQLPTAATAGNPVAATGMGVVADAAAVATAAAAAANAAATVMPATLPPPPGPSGKYAIGTFVTKHFPAFGWFKGRIIHYDHTCKRYKIQYEDTDLEDLSESELTKVFERAERAKPGNEQEDGVRRKRRARYDVGTKVKKLFYAFGWFEGTIEEYDEETEYYRIVYADGDKEDLDEEEVFEILMDPRNHKKPRHWIQQKLTKKEKEEYMMATFDPFQVFWMPVAPPPPLAKYEVGTEVYKFFGDFGWFKGTVVSFDAPSQLYKVQYEDKDKEDLEERELAQLLEGSVKGPLGKYSVGRAISKYFPGHGWFKGTIISYDAILRLYKVQYEDKDKEDLDVAEATKALEDAEKEKKETPASPKKRGRLPKADKEEEK